MDSTHPADLSPLAYGTGLALGLLLILGLPRDPAATRRERPAVSRREAWQASAQTLFPSSRPANNPPTRQLLPR